MKWQLLGAALALLATAGPARAVPEMVAGWNFSQYSGDGSLDTDGDFLNEATLSANFSNRIPGDGAGAAANPYGTMYMDGSKGSTAIDVDGFPPAFGPSQAAGGSLTTNLGAPTSSGTPAGAIPFNGPCANQDGQTSCESLAMLANPTQDPLRIVFEASLAEDGLQGEDWFVSFAGKTLGSGTSSLLSIDFSLDGVSYAAATTRTLTSTDTAFTVDFSGVPGDSVAKAYIRFAFAAVSGSEPLIDNVAIFAGNVVPEPSTALLLLGGLVGLARAGRRRA
jgi:hypothetical protein